MEAMYLGGMANNISRTLPAAVPLMNQLTPPQTSTADTSHHKSGVPGRGDRVFPGAGGKTKPGGHVGLTLPGALT